MIDCFVASNSSSNIKYNLISVFFFGYTSYDIKLSINSKWSDIDKTLNKEVSCSKDIIDTC